MQAEEIAICHNVHSECYCCGIPVPYWLYITVAVVDAALIALCVFYFVRRRKNVKRWKEQNSVQA